MADVRIIHAFVEGEERELIEELEQQLADYKAHAGDFAEECHRLNATLDRAVELAVIAEDEKAQMERDMEELRDAHLARGNYVLEVERERDEAKEFQARAEALLESCEVERDGYFDALTKRNYEVLNLSSQLEGARRERDKAKGGPRDPLGLLAENVDLSSQLEGARRERDEAWDRYAEVVTENREMRALLGQVIDGDDVAVEAAVLLHSGFTPLTAVEVERVKGLEAVAEAVAKSDPYTGTKLDVFRHGVFEQYTKADWCMYCGAECDLDGNTAHEPDCLYLAALAALEVK